MGCCYWLAFWTGKYHDCGCSKRQRKSVTPRETSSPSFKLMWRLTPETREDHYLTLTERLLDYNSQIYSRTGGYMGLSFAIPIDVAINVAEQLKKNGKVIRGWLGVAIQEITEDLSESFGMKDTRGALIAMVEKDSPAEKGGILPGDVILKFNNNPLDSSSDLPTVCWDYQALK